MECLEFQSHLRAYLIGEVDEPLFGDLVEHEASCPSCRALVAERATELEPPAWNFGEADFRKAREEIRARTEGADCLWVELRMAEALEEPLASAESRLVREHVADCTSCQRMRDALQALPTYYAAFPRLRAERSLTRVVLERTLGPRPSFADVVRALWRRPDAVWEAAMACALIGAVIFGGRLPTYHAVSTRIQEVAQAQVPGLAEGQAARDDQRFGVARKAAAEIAAAWAEFEGRAEAVSAWMKRVGDDVREGDHTGLLEELRTVLEPIGLYPGEAEDPSVETNSEVDSNDGSSRDGGDDEPER